MSAIHGTWSDNCRFKSKTFMDHNDSGKFECVFTSVEIEKNNSIMFKNFKDTNLGIWSAHGEGKFILPGEETDYNIIGKYSKNSFHLIQWIRFQYCNFSK